MTSAEEILAALSAANLIDEFEMLTLPEQFEYLRNIDEAPSDTERTDLIEEMCQELSRKAAG